MTEPQQAQRPRSNRRRNVLIALLVLALAVLLSLRWVSRPDQVARLTLDQLGQALGLEITASGTSQYRLRGAPMLVVRDLVVRQPGATKPLLTAQRAYLSLPWSTIRARGADLTITRIELDAPQLDLPALQAWQATRPPSEARVPTLTDGLQVLRGRVIGPGWSIEALDLQLPSLHPQRPVAAHLAGRYVRGDEGHIRVPFDLHAALTAPANAAGLGAVGAVGALTVETPGWRLPMQARLSGRVYRSEAGFRLERFEFGARARYVGGEVELPFAFGLAGDLGYRGGRLALEPLALDLRGQGLVPRLDARGRFALADAMTLQLGGTLARWPEAWPTLPPPLGQSAAPLPFELGYRGDSDLSGTTSLHLQREATRFDGRFHLPEVLEWMDATMGTPLPPLDGTLSTPRLEIAGAVLEGVEVEFDDGPAAP
ncbi:hypothetical protein [Lysobacter sp. D1-1-M9]|uniref:hypothetical protein n=1 Tax=Novilysobacter longmucuonensis TaxID=3098603 RepID=UPI002FC81D15